MQIAAILVHVDANCEHDARLPQALMVATHFRAVLIGLLTESVETLSLRSRGVSRRDLDPLSRASWNAARRAFDTATEHATFPVDWRVGEGSPAEVIQREGRLADLTVVGQPRAGSDPDRRAHAWERHLVESAIFGIGRPVLQIPRRLSRRSIGHRILIAWHGSRACARALQDSLPWLERAAQIDIVGPFFPEFRQFFSAAPVACAMQWLEHHGINATFTETLTTSKAAARATLLSHAQRRDSDLIVCGVDTTRDTWVSWDDGTLGSFGIQAPVAVLFAH